MELTAEEQGLIDAIREARAIRATLVASFEPEFVAPGGEARNTYQARLEAAHRKADIAAKLAFERAR